MSASAASVASTHTEVEEEECGPQPVARLEVCCNNIITLAKISFTLG